MSELRSCAKRFEGLEVKHIGLMGLVFIYLALPALHVYLVVYVQNSALHLINAVFV